MEIKDYIREIQDFPKPGIGFKDITTLFKDAEAFGFVVDNITGHYKNKKVTKVVSLESRGFIVGGALAYHLKAGFIPIRKEGKLPWEKYICKYDLEYGEDTIAIHTDALNENDVVLIHDDLLATGGTALAALELVKTFNVKKIYFSFIVDLSFLANEKKKLLENYEVHVVTTY